MATKIKIKMSNTGTKHTQYHCNGGVAGLSPGTTKELAVDEGKVLYFENDGGTKYTLSASDNGKTFYYTK